MEACDEQVRDWLEDRALENIARLARPVGAVKFIRPADHGFRSPGCASARCTHGYARAPRRGETVREAECMKAATRLPPWTSQYHKLGLHPIFRLDPPHQLRGRLIQPNLSKSDLKSPTTRVFGPVSTSRWIDLRSCGSSRAGSGPFGLLNGPPEPSR